jgi:LysM repeat protein
MKLVKIFGIVMAFHGVAFMFIFAIPGCRSTSKKPAAAAPAIAEEASPLSPAVENAAPMESPLTSSEVSAVRFSPTRPGTPAAAQVATQSAPSGGQYTVVKGDNLWSIAKKNGVTVKQLTAANNLRADATLKLGQVLTVPGKAPAPAAASTPASPSRSTTASSPAASSVTHVVKAGETLGGIAKKYQVKVGEIATANNIADPTKLRVGQSLKIPGWQAPASTKAASSAKPAPAVSTPAPAPEPAPAEPAPAPAAPVFDSPIAPAPLPGPEATESPFVSPAPNSEAPMIRVEESGAPKIE